MEEEIKKEELRIVYTHPKLISAGREIMRNSARGGKEKKKVSWFDRLKIFLKGDKGS